MASCWSYSVLFRGAISLSVALSSQAAWPWLMTTEWTVGFVWKRPTGPVQVTTF